MRFLLLSACLAVTRAENVAMTSSDIRVEDSLGFDLALGPANFPLVNAVFQGRYMYTANGAMQVQDLQTNTIAVLDRPGFLEAVTVAVNEARSLAVFGVVGAISGSGLFVYDLRSDPMNPTLINPEGSEIDIDGRITSVASGGDVIAYVLATADPPTGAVDITFVDLPDPLPESDHTNDDANAADDENVTGFPPVDDLTDGARGRRAGFAAAACVVVALAF